MGVLEELFAELHVLIRAHGISAAPHMHERNVWILKYRIEFEPHGRASETWEYAWHLELPWCYHHYQKTDGLWYKGRNYEMMCFKQRHMKQVIRQACKFLMDAQSQGLRLGDNIREQSTKKAPEQKTQE